MKRNNAFFAALAAATALATASALAGPLNRSDTGTSTAQSTQDTPGAVEHGVAHRQMQLEKMAKTAISKLRRKNQNAAQSLDQAYGVAVFNTTKGGAIVTGVGGTGVAMTLSALDHPQRSRKTTFMHVGGGGAGLTAGASNYKLIVLLKNKSAYRNFTNGEWTGASTAQATAGKTGSAAEAVWHNGVKVYRMTNAGLMAGIDITGLRFWRSAKLNKGHA